MTEDLKNLENDADGMATYDYIVNHVGTCREVMPALVENMLRADVSGQFLASSARFLAAVDREAFEPWLAPLIEGTIEKDREHRYIGSLLEAQGEGRQFPPHLQASVPYGYLKKSRQNEQ